MKVNFFKKFLMVYKAGGEICVYSCSWSHLNHFLGLDIDDQQPALKRLGHVDVLLPDVDG